MKNFLCGSGWKMYLTCEETAERIKQLQDNLKDFHDFRVVVFPSFTTLSDANKNLDPDSCVHIGGQDMFWEKEGAYTGEISAKMLLDVGCEYVEINHQERRRFLHETDEMANKKLKCALSTSLVPFLCVGEEKKEDAASVKEFLSHQIKNLLNGIEKKDAQRIVFAYEPMWAIGKYEATDPEYIQTTHRIIRDIIAELYDQTLADNAYIIYGGGVNHETFLDLVALPDVNGLFTTGCGIVPDVFADVILRSAEYLKNQE
ncbi:MAG: triose-phosphate isomerase family protein [Pseudoramibacter sp.]